MSGVTSSSKGIGISMHRQGSNESNSTKTNYSKDQTSKESPPPYPVTGKTVIRIPQRPPDRHQSLSYTNSQSSSVQDAMKQRVRLLEIENRRLMANQGQLVAETNRRIELHTNEVRMLKEEVRNLQMSNKELRDLCCFLDDDRQKTRRLSREWQKFGKYTSEVMKQEVKAYQAKLRELEDRQQLMINENEELKRLCLYLDEQRQSLLIARAEGALNVEGHSTNNKINDNSIGCDSSGCGSSTGSNRGSEDGDNDEHLKPDLGHTNGYDHKQENTLRMITQQMQTSISLEQNSPRGDVNGSGRSSASHNDRLFEYIQSLESRIRQLELSNQQNADAFWRANGNLMSEMEKRSTLEKDEFNGGSSPQSDNAKSNESMRPLRRLDHFQADRSFLRSNARKEMFESTTSTMTSSGTTYCSSETDDSADTAVFVMGDEMDAGASVLEVRTLGPIDEEKEEEASRSDSINRNSRLECKQRNSSESASENIKMPPVIAPVSASVSRLSLCSSEISLEGPGPASPRQQTGPKNSDSDNNTNFTEFPTTCNCPDSSLTRNSESGSSCVRDSLAEAVKVLRVHEMAARKNMRGLTAQETAIVQHMCQVGDIAWDSLDRKSHSLGNSRTEAPNPVNQMTAV